MACQYNKGIAYSEDVSHVLVESIEDDPRQGGVAGVDVVIVEGDILPELHVILDDPAITLTRRGRVPCEHYGAWRLVPAGHTNNTYIILSIIIINSFIYN